MILVKKVIAFDENLIYPDCNGCGRELSPYQIEGGMDRTTLTLFALSNLVLGKLNDKPVVLFCPKCVAITDVCEGRF